MRRFSWAACWLVLVLVPAVALSAAAPSEKSRGPTANVVQARTPEEQAKQSGFQVAIAIDHTLGAGTFVDASRYSLLVGTLSLGPQYLFGLGDVRLAASASARLAFEYTLPDAPTGRRVSVGDLRLGLSAPAIYTEKTLTQIAVSPSVSLVLPTSPESLNAAMIASLSAGVTMSRRFSRFDVRASVGGSRGFYAFRYSGARATSARDGQGNLLVLSRVGEPISGFFQMNPAWSLNVGGQLQWRVTDTFFCSIGYSYSHQWRTAATLEDDAQTSKALDSNGNQVARSGMGDSDRTGAFVGASYQLNDHYALDLGVSTSQSPLTPTGQVRFPFLSLGTWADNATTFSLTVTAAY